jgi:uncharacterized repeat protein (TIGR03803 family)
LIFDNSGNLYGATLNGGSGKGGTIYKLTPGNGAWSFSTVFSFTGNGGQQDRGPYGRIILMPDGTIYGATSGDGLYNYGAVFKLTLNGGRYTYTSLHDFTGGLDGGYARSYLVMDKSGNLYGAAAQGGSGNTQQCSGACGVVYEVSP